MPGLEEALRARGAPAVPTAVLSRGLVGTMGRALVVNLPGSTGGVRDGVAVLAPVLAHALGQLRGGDDHAPPSPRDGARVSGGRLAGAARARPGGAAAAARA